ncbi:MAG TPA: hypothetical protein VLH08_06655, partial [Acidobacteriota bacterium]|nr:hypothetical protein [Acidobacteriota bacterium]
MDDWKKYVRDHFQTSNIRPEREAEIVEELAQQLDEVYNDALRNGLNEEQARNAVDQHIPDWGKFAATVARAQQKQTKPLDTRLEDRLDRKSG